MVQRKVITSVGRSERPSSKGLAFDRSMIPLAGGNGSGSELIREFRMNAWAAFEALPYPSLTDEAWRRTDIHAMYNHDFRLPESGRSASLLPIPAEYRQPLMNEQLGGQVVLQPDGSQIYLNSGLVEKGVIFTDLVTAERQYPAILMQIMGRIVKPGEGKFAALANALSRNGVLIYIPRGLQVVLPLHSILWGPGRELAHFSQIMVWVEDGASLTYVHESASPTESEGGALHAGTVEVLVGAEANFRFVELQSWGRHVWNFTHERIKVGQGSQVEWIFAAVGSHLTKNFSTIDLVGKGASGRMSGFYFTDGKQHLDHDTQQNHLAPNTTSDLLFKGALKDQSRSVWQGMIYVAPDAQKSDGYQANRNLTLSKEARADSLPGLEILADDVRCTHGATVGNINPDELFYLQSRGIPQSVAERVIVEGFFDPIMQRIPFDTVRDRLTKAIEDKIG